jgi:hypothetical protein
LKKGNCGLVHPHQTDYYKHNNFRYLPPYLGTDEVGRLDRGGHLF